MAEVVHPNLSLNLNQYFQKHILLNDLNYDHYSKYLAAACKSQSGSEVVILTKEGNLLNVLSYFPTDYEPVFVSWVPPPVHSSSHHSSPAENMLLVVTTDNALCVYRNGYGCVGSWTLAFRNSELSRSVSCLAVTSLGSASYSDDADVMVALGSHLGVVSLVPLSSQSLATSNSEHEPYGLVDTLSAHNGGVYALAFGSAAGKLVLATGGLDGTVKLWEHDQKFLFKRSLRLAPSNGVHTTHLPGAGSDGSPANSRHPNLAASELASTTLLRRVNSLAFSKRGELAASTDSAVFLFRSLQDWTLFQVLTLPPSFHSPTASTAPASSGAPNPPAAAERSLVVSFSNDKLVLMRADSEAFVLKRSDLGQFELDSRLNH